LAIAGCAATHSERNASSEYRSLPFRLETAQWSEPYSGRSDSQKVLNARGRAMKGWILVAPDGLSNDAALAKWVRAGANYAATLPGKR
jgi:hypothetical protein